MFRETLHLSKKVLETLHLSKKVFLLVLQFSLLQSNHQETEYEGMVSYLLWNISPIGGEIFLDQGNGYSTFFPGVDSGVKVVLGCTGRYGDYRMKYIWYSNENRFQDPYTPGEDLLWKIDFDNLSLTVGENIYLDNNVTFTCSTGMEWFWYNNIFKNMTNSLKNRWFGIGPSIGFTTIYKHILTEFDSLSCYGTLSTCTPWFVNRGEVNRGEVNSLKVKDLGRTGAVVDISLGFSFETVGVWRYTTSISWDTKTVFNNMYRTSFGNPESLGFVNWYFCLQGLTVAYKIVV